MCFRATTCSSMYLSCLFYIWRSHRVFLIVMTFCLIGTGSQPTSTEVHSIYCDTELFHPVCEEGSVIVMSQARYGRMELSRCVEIDMGFLGCERNVLDIVDKKCSGRRECQIRVPDPELENTKPCLKELKTYLDATYSCIPLVDIPYNRCTQYHHINTSMPSGWIASEQTWDNGCGGPEHPWIISVKPGQRINITLYDFSIEKNVYIMDSNDLQVCHEYAIVRETDSWDDYVCGGVRRVKHAYLSKGSTVEVHITNKERKYFLLHYEALGCGNLSPTENGWFERAEDGTGSAGCLHDDTRVSLVCQDNEWRGTMPNCTQPAVMVTALPVGDIALPIGASVAIIICAALLVGVAVVIIGLVRFKTMKDRNGNTTRPLESISLHEKPIHPQPTDLTRDLADCALEATSPPPGDTITINTTPRLIRHQRTVKINGNEYAHIWESPLPSADSRHNPNAACCNLAGSSANTGAHMECGHYRTVVRDTGTLGKNTTYLFKPPHGDCFHLYGATTAHGALPQLGPQASPMRHMRACPQSGIAHDTQVPRYSSLESKENALNDSNNPAL